MAVTKPKRVGVWENLGTSLVDLESTTARRAARRLGAWVPRRARWRRPTAMRPSAVALALLLGLLALLAFRGYSVLPLPAALAHPALPLGLAGGALAMVLRAHWEARRAEVFYRRFLRPGLKRLLDAQGDSLRNGEKFFRGCKTVILKIDIADFTLETFAMPYGMRRLFLDLWFTLIDQVVADQVFFDKSLGDGSFYCFDQSLPGGTCHAALRAAVAIRDRQVPLFDETFRRLLCEKLRASPELAEHAQRFLATYREVNGASFWDRTTRIRIALVSGYVDEGLWGMSSQSHYDVQGSLPILATRLEHTASDGEIVFDEGFAAELEEERPGAVDLQALDQRLAVLKGIGARHVFAIRPGSDPWS